MILTLLPWLIAATCVLFAWIAGSDARHAEDRADETARDCAYWRSEAERMYAERPIDPRIAALTDSQCESLLRDIFAPVKPSPYWYSSLDEFCPVVRDEG